MAQKRNIGLEIRALSCRLVCALVLCALVLTGARLLGAGKSNNVEIIPPFPALVAEAKANHIPLDEVDPPLDTNTLTPGDSATILATEFEKGGRRYQWLIIMEAVAPTKRERSSKATPPQTIYTSIGSKFEYASTRAYANVRTLGPFVEANARRKPPSVEDDTSHIALDTGFLSLGFDQAAAAGCRIARLKSDDEYSTRNIAFSKAEIAKGKKLAAASRITTDEDRCIAGATAALLAYFGVAEEAPALSKILFKVFDAPSIWSILKKGRMPGVQISADIWHARAEDPAKWYLAQGSPVYYLPGEVLVNKEPRLHLAWIVTAPRPPVLITGGVICLVAQNPADQENYLTLYLISARHGGGATRENAGAPVLAADPPASDTTPGTNSLCDRIAMIGASVTHGFTASEPFGGAKSEQYNLARYIDAALQVPHGPISNLGNAFFFSGADASGEQQISHALQEKATLVIGIDFLFWFCYGKGFDEPGRLQHFEDGLHLLDSIQCPLVIGDIPDASAAVNGMLSPDEMPGAETLAAANRRLKDWAAARPRVAVVPLAKFMATVVANEALSTHGFSVPAGKTRALLQDDKLHPTSRGCAMLALAILDAMKTGHPTLNDSAVLWDGEKVFQKAMQALHKEQADSAKPQ